MNKKLKGYRLEVEIDNTTFIYYRGGVNKLEVVKSITDDMKSRNEYGEITRIEETYSALEDMIDSLSKD